MKHGSNPETSQIPNDRHVHWRKAWPLAATSLLLLAMQARPAAQHQQDAQQLAREVIQNEIQAEINDHNLWSYRELTKRDGKAMLFEYRQTKAGTINRLLAVNGCPLDARQRQAEDERIRKLIRSPDAMRQAQKKADADARETREFLQLFPKAFLFREEQHQGDVMSLGFTPNPKFHPTGNEARVLHSMQGTMVVDVTQKRLVSVKGRLMRAVEFWGGLLGHLNPGGTFAVSLENVAPGDWELKSLDVEMRGKALLFKTIGAQEHETYSDYKPVPPDATLEQAAELLRKNSAG
jgi:hypothetical protein